MSSVITVRGIDPADKSWLKNEARHKGVSMEELVRRLIREQRKKSRSPAKISDAFKRYFGPHHGVDLPLPQRHSYRPLAFSEENQS
ncbi:MAG: hypothetical protein OXD47_04375 [Gammaproteobacteria bacterium]|nr:hypothetical protein [Gammaproteobacteria bacterium]MCY4283158.1 hypothetical protein [Gammaproteobacteria bacterium]MCY4338018.1 hypothetical protein [Gammaproteobacteria bacterium]